MADELDPAIEAAQRACSDFGRVPLSTEIAAAQKALDPIKAALDRWHQNYLDVAAGPGAAIRSEMVCLDALHEIGTLAGWKEPE